MKLLWKLFVEKLRHLTRCQVIAASLSNHHKAYHLNQLRRLHVSGTTLHAGKAGQAFPDAL